MKGLSAKAARPCLPVNFVHDSARTGGDKP